MSRAGRQARMSRRSLLRLMSAGAASAALASAAGPIGLLTGCRAKPTSTPAADGQQVQLVYQDWRTPWFPKMAQDMLDHFHAENPDIRVFYTPDPETVEETLQRDMQAGTAPDVFAGCCTFLPILAQQGHVLDLSPYVAAHLDQTVIDDWDVAQYEWFFTEAKLQFGLPKYHGALALYYNKDLFDGRGVDYPDGEWSHDDYLEAMRQLAQDRNGDGKTDLWGSLIDISWDRIQMYINGWGGHIVDPEDASRPLVCEDQAMAAMAWIRERMWVENVMARPLDVQDVETRQAFSEGQVAMVEDGSWALRDILEQAAFRIGVAPLPAGPARKVTLATTDGFGIYARTKHPDQAWRLLEFLTSKDYGRAMAKTNFLQPARASLVEEWAEFVRDEYPGQAREMDLEAFADGHLNGYSATAEIFGDMARAKPILSDAWHQAYTLGAARLEDVMPEACRKIVALSASQRQMRLG